MSAISRNITTNPYIPRPLPKDIQDNLIKTTNLFIKTINFLGNSKNVSQVHESHSSLGSKTLSTSAALLNSLNDYFPNLAKKLIENTLTELPALFDQQSRREIFAPLIEDNIGALSSHLQKEIRSACSQFIDDTDFWQFLANELLREIQYVLNGVVQGGEAFCTETKLNSSSYSYKEKALSPPSSKVSRDLIDSIVKELIEMLTSNVSFLEASPSDIKSIFYKQINTSISILLQKALPVLTDLVLFDQINPITYLKGRLLEKLSSKEFDFKQFYSIYETYIYKMEPEEISEWLYQLMYTSLTDHPHDPGTLSKDQFLERLDWELSKALDSESKQEKIKHEELLRLMDLAKKKILENKLQLQSLMIKRNEEIQNFINSLPQESENLIETLENELKKPLSEKMTMSHMLIFKHNDEIWERESALKFKELLNTIYKDARTILNSTEEYLERGILPHSTATLNLVTREEHKQLFTQMNLLLEKGAKELLTTDQHFDDFNKILNQAQSTPYTSEESYGMMSYLGGFSGLLTGGAIAATAAISAPVGLSLAAASTLAGAYMGRQAETATPEEIKRFAKELSTNLIDELSSKHFRQALAFGLFRGLKNSLEMLKKSKVKIKIENNESTLKYESFRDYTPSREDAPSTETLPSFTRRPLNSKKLS